MNALRSTGPTSDGGKARSSQNPLIHGLTAQHHPLLGDEEQDDYLQMRRAVFDQYRPSTEYAGLLAGRLADDFWRLARIPKFEVRMLEYQSHATEPQGEDGGAAETTTSAAEQQGRSLRLWIIPSDAFGKLTRYEAAIMKKIKATVELLEGLPKAVEAPPAKLPGVPTPTDDAETIRRRIEVSMSERYPR